MGFRNNCYATVWERKSTKKVVNMHETYAEIYLTTSSKNSKGNWETDFCAVVRFIGKAFETVRTLALQSKDRLKLTSVDVQIYYNRETNQKFTCYICWECETVEAKSKNVRQPEIIEAENGKLLSYDVYDLPF